MNMLGGGGGLGDYVGKRGVRDCVTRRVGSQKVEKSFSDPLPCMFLLGEKLLVVRSCECSVSVVFRPSVAAGMRVFCFPEVGERACEQGNDALRPLARTEKSQWPSSFHLCRLVSHLASSAAS